jgi:hypothetical protein
MNKAKEILLGALREGMTHSGEQRLYKSGKLPGLFTGRTSLNAELATRALQENLLELVRTETRGKTPVEWVKVTQKGIDFVLKHESPVRALDELRMVLQVNQAGIPVWIADMKKNLNDLEKKFIDEIQTISHRLDLLTGQVLEAIKRAENGSPPLPEGTVNALPWADDAVAYLERRNKGGLGNRCPLPELFAAVREKEKDVTIKDFHSGLRRLHDRGVLRLLAHEDNEGPPEPEFALLDGPTMYYYAAR